MFPFLPKLVIILCSRSSSYNDIGIFLPGGCVGIMGYSTNTGSGSGITLMSNVALSNQTLDWYSGRTATLQLNESGVTYYYAAIG